MTEAQRRAAEIRRRFSERVDAVRADRTLSEEGRQIQIAAAFVQARDEVAQLRQREAAEVGSDRRSAARALFGPPAAALTGDQALLEMNYRAALAVADATSKPEELLELLDRAAFLGLDVDARAVAAVAFGRLGSSLRDLGGRSYAEILDAYVALYPERAKFLERVQAARTSDSRLMQFSISKPNEIRGIDVDEFAARAS